MKPVARVDQVMDGSPAHRCGMLAGDLILRFGSVVDDEVSGPSTFLTLIGQVVRDSEGRPIELIVRREVEAQAQAKKLFLVPQTWSGKGLVGCVRSFPSLVVSLWSGATSYPIGQVKQSTSVLY
jgi:26S proteasome non-ATPase regulatory subunit 9